MNKRRFFLFLSVIFCLVLIPVLYLLLRQPASETSLLTASGRDEVNQFYYRAVPGLKRAEEENLVRDINKRLEWPGRNAAVYIDRIWYNVKSVTIFYHVEGISETAFLGGDLYLPSEEPHEVQPFHGTHSIGRASEKGILYQDSFYSCLKLPPLRALSNQVLSEIEKISFTPYINLLRKKDGGMESTRLKSFEILLNYNTDEEEIIKIPLDSQIDIDGRQLHFYQIDLSPSALQLYFQYLKSERDMVYRVKGSYSTAKGEVHTFDSMTKAITKYPYHYIIEIPPFHIRPDTLQVHIDSISCISNESVEFLIDTSQFGGKNRSYAVELGKKRIKNTDVLISNINLNRQAAEIFVSFVSDANEASAPIMGLEPVLPKWEHKGSDGEEPSCRLAVLDSDLQPYNLDIWNYGLDLLPGEGIRIRLDRRFWDDSSVARVQLKNLAYIYYVNKEVSLPLLFETSSDE